MEKNNYGRKTSKERDPGAINLPRHWVANNKNKIIN